MTLAIAANILPITVKAEPKVRKAKSPVAILEALSLGAAASSVLAAAFFLATSLFV